MVAASASEELDVVIIGAGISGINASYRLQTMTKWQNYTVLEGRSEMGGTWSLFNYPGIRSDSDMYTLGFPFRPWLDAKGIASGEDILKYVKDTARETGVDKHIRYNHKVQRLDWNSETKRWTLYVNANGQEKTFTSRFVYSCAGYYSYDEGHNPELPGQDNFQGKLVHPQFWPKDLDYVDKKVVVVGSGATAITVVPAMAEKVKSITMLQRSPGYFLKLPRRDAVVELWKKILPSQAAHSFIRMRNAFRAYLLVWICKGFPSVARRVLRYLTAKELPPHIPLDPHFNPSYNPWDQRICLDPDGEFFASLRSGKANIATGHIDTITSNGIKLKDGSFLEADIIIAATGLKMTMAGGSQLYVDGKKKDIGQLYIYKGQMLEDVPNFGLCLGYTNASWTLGSDLASRYIARLINEMDKKGIDVVTPRCDHTTVNEKPLINLNSGYITRARKDLPKGGNKAPWYLRHSFFYDLLVVKFGSVLDSLELSAATRAQELTE
ncbi:monooxygenase, flavin-binding family [Ceraceosorus guamensis]|uniref:Monooxygenase, flavin-binding family n=1 Tax=Ceraceosorus guamensis TaxID=1522189 RepID=A0A316VZU8_9BASI|nr:monooxygenase, flavin-binding family [Ceraceosorus guamensis]PWN42794.1 monooxygenase, flavin-binding family [Ceraceosorus guamensis]